MSAAFSSRIPAPSLTDRQVFRLLFAGTFVIFLVAVVIGRLVGVLGALPSRPTKSIIAEARETASSTLLFAFMG